MKTHILAILALILMSGAAAYAQPHGDHHGGPAGHAAAPRGPAPAMDRHMDNRAGPAMNNRPMAAAPGPRPGPAMINRPAFAEPARGNPRGRRGPGPVASGHHLPPGIGAPRGHDRAPMWHGRSWAVGDLFYFGGFSGPTITDFDGYDLPPPRPGTHWIYVDGWFLMVGNRSGRIFAEVPADY
jgi:Ni/Co efflux regulator RcnB